MKRALIFATLALIAGSAWGQDRVISQHDMVRADNRAPAVFSTTRTNGVDSPHVIVDGTVAIGTGGVGTTRTPSGTSVTSSGSVATGAKDVTFIFSSDFTGTVAGLTFAGVTDASQRFIAPAGDTLSAIAYTRTAGSIRIVDLR